MNCKSILEFLAIARMFSGKNFCIGVLVLAIV